MTRKLYGIAACFLMLCMAACSGDDVSGASEPTQTENISSSIEPASSDAAGTVINSSTTIESSGGTVAESSSSDSESSNGNNESSAASSSSGITGPCTTPESVSDLWYGPSDIYGYVNTGLDNGSETSGYWFSFGDEKAGSYVAWPERHYEYETSLDPILEECKGVCGTFKYRDEGFTGIGFNVAGEALLGSKGALDIADISAWDGLCVTYASETDMDVTMFSDSVCSFVEKVALMPRVLLPKSVEAKTVCSKWSDFASAAETPGNPTHVASILFVAYGNAGTASRFNVIGVGKYADAKNICKQGADPFVSGTK